jgi:hypothetical protein
MRRKDTDGMMNGKEFEKALVQLGLSQRRAALHLLGLNERTVRRWVTDEAAVLPPAAQFLRYLIATKKSGDYAIKKLEE